MNARRRIVIVLLGCAALGAAHAQDAEDLYRDARRALNRQDFGAAIDGFRQLRNAHPDSARVAESYYWEAFALERDGALDAAVAALDTLLREHPSAATADDARALRLQTCSELAGRGNNLCAADVASSVSNPAALDEATRRAAVNALINMRPERAVPLAMEVLASTAQPLDVRKQALFVLADKADGAHADQVRDTLLETARDSTNDLELRGQAVFWLSEVPGDATLDALAELLNMPAEQGLAEAAVFAVAQIDTPRAATLLRDFAANETVQLELREQAVFWIAEEGGAQALPYLKELHETTPSAALKEQILFAATLTGEPAALDWLVARAGDTGEALETRKQALFWAADAGLPLEDLNTLYHGATEPELREHVIWLIAEHESEGALEELNEIARTDPDPDMRERAVFWLGDSDDARAEQYLRELLVP
jgi:tetratricopeptide (TPR) repeat protein